MGEAAGRTARWRRGYCQPRAAGSRPGDRGLREPDRNELGGRAGEDHALPLGWGLAGAHKADESCCLFQVALAWDPVSEFAKELAQLGAANICQAI